MSSQVFFFGNSKNSQVKGITEDLSSRQTLFGMKTLEDGLADLGSAKSFLLFLL